MLVLKQPLCALLLSFVKQNDINKAIKKINEG